jgi:hypothetical protein
MGKPYDTELVQLSTTYEWACNFDISALQKAIETAYSLPLLVVGSGGSLTAAHFMASLHRRYTGQIATVATPLDSILEQLNHRVSIWLLSAGGRNVDINESFSEFVLQEPTQLCVLCSRPDSPLTVKAKQHSYVDLLEFSLPSGKDGFLATNSLFAFCLLIGRAYHNAFSDIQNALDHYMPPAKLIGLDKIIQSKWRKEVDPLWARETTIVLHGTASRSGAIDIESKFTEAALGNLQMADYRNFAHGRHHWLAKRGKASGILAFVTDEDRKLADKTLMLIPDDIPVARIDLNGDYTTASLASIVAALHIAGWAGIARGIDPGRPGVPVFGRKIYHLTLPNKKKHNARFAPEDAIALERKAGVKISEMVSRGIFTLWQTALTTFKESLAAATFKAVVFDYDGTLVDTRERFSPPKELIISELVRFIEAGITIGIATGRGASIRKDLQKCLPQSLWDRVIIGYYNGAVIASLADDSQPDKNCTLGDEMAVIAHALHCHTELKVMTTQKDRAMQITLRPKIIVYEDRVWDIVNNILQIHGLHNISIVRSSHSIDILAPRVTKQRVIDYINDIDINCHDNVILRIGDRGRWPGNDFALLHGPYALSVDEVSTDLSTCWNLAPPGHRGVQATLGYCHALQIKSHGICFVFDKQGYRS